MVYVLTSVGHGNLGDPAVFYDYSEVYAEMESEYKRLAANYSDCGIEQMHAWCARADGAIHWCISLCDIQ